MSKIINFPVPEKTTNICGQCKIFEHCFEESLQYSDCGPNTEDVKELSKTIPACEKFI